MHTQKEEPSTEPCDCSLPDCAECNQRLIDRKDEVEMNTTYLALDEQEESDWQRQLEGGDDDDYDEDDMHGSHPIDDPDKDERDE